MNGTTPGTTTQRRSWLIKNWLSLTGLVIVAGSLFSFLLLFLLDSLAHFANPYVGVLTYLVAPVFTVIGLALTGLGILRWRWRIAKKGEAIQALRIDLSRARDRRLMAVFVSFAGVFLLVSALGSYQTYHFTESVQFCGQACHTVMQPE